MFCVFFYACVAKKDYKGKFCYTTLCCKMTQMSQNVSEEQWRHKKLAGATFPFKMSNLAERWHSTTLWEERTVESVPDGGANRTGGVGVGEGSSSWQVEIVGLMSQMDLPVYSAGWCLLGWADWTDQLVWRAWLTHPAWSAIKLHFCTYLTAVCL